MRIYLDQFSLLVIIETPEALSTAHLRSPLLPLSWHGPALTEASSEGLRRLGHEVQGFVVEVRPVLGDLDLLLLHEVVRSDWWSGNLQPGLGLRPADPLHVSLLNLVHGDEPVDVVPGLHHLVVPVDTCPGRAENLHNLRGRSADLGSLVQTLVPVAESYRVTGLLHSFWTGSWRWWSRRARSS